MSELPNGWAWSTLGEVAGPPQYGWTTKAAKAGAVRFLRTTDITKGPIRWGAVPFCEEPPPAISKFQLELGDIVVSRAGSVGASALIVDEAPPVAAFASYLIRFRPSEHTDARFVAFYLRSPAYWQQIADSAAGIALQNVNAQKLSAVAMTIAPVAEQERIVTAIEEAFSKLDAGEAGLRTARQLLKRMREAVLAAAVAGRLVSQDPTDTPAIKLLADLGVASTTSGDGSPEGWAHVRLGDVASVGSGTTPRRGHGSYWDDGTVPWVTSGLITNGVIREAREFVTERALRETSLRLWPAGTLLVAMYGEGQTRGRCAELGLKATCNQACAAISLLEPLRGYKDFLRLSFDANYAANRRLASGGVQPNLNAGLIKDMVLSLPPPEEQARVVAEVERQLSFVEACERAVDVGLARAAGLRRSVLKSAFEGRLVPQDPSDESAMALLERIRSQRAPKSPAKRARQTA